VSTRTAREPVVHNWQRATDLVLDDVVERVYQRSVPDGHLTVIGREPQGWHLSISHRTNEIRPKPGRYPTWDEIADARYQFVPNEVTMAMVLPPREEYVNVHSTTFHLHQIKGEFA